MEETRYGMQRNEYVDHPGRSSMIYHAIFRTWLDISDFEHRNRPNGYAVEQI